MDKTQKRQTERSYSASEKCTAVLSVWTEKRKPAVVCRELGVKWMTFHQWQSRAMEGMLQALEPRVNLDRGPALSPRLLAMLEKRSNRAAMPTVAANRLENRLTKIRELKQPEKKVEPAEKT
ncbi:MAG: transposase [Fibrobacterota bacterium]